MKINQSSTIAIILLAVLSLVSFSACEEKEDEDKLTGKWISITKDYNYGDTIVFTQNNTVEKWFEPTPPNYEEFTVDYYTSNDTIYFKTEGSTSPRKFSFNNSNLTIYGLTSVFSVLALEPKDVTFKKIE